MKDILIATKLLIAALLLAMIAGCSESVAEKGNSAEIRADKPVAATTESQAKLHARTFRFDYGFALTDLPTDARVRVWMPVPPSNRHQTVAELDRKLPAQASVAKETKYGNVMLYLEPKVTKTGELDFQVSYRVERKEVRGRKPSDSDLVIKTADRKRFLAPNVTVPLEGKPLELIAGLKLPQAGLGLGRRLYDRVDEHMTYDKSKPGYGRGDVNWACDSRFGNCTDFHSLFVSLARSQGLPARFEIGFPIPENRESGSIGGYHCWAYFFVENHGWVPIDISEADKQPDKKDYFFGNLTPDRVVFTTGRDIELVPRQTGKPLNYFVYPYVEVNGKPWPRENMQTRFGFQEL
jgi:transglutaminase-like putative cysteine protease